MSLSMFLVLFFCSALNFLLFKVGLHNIRKNMPDAITMLNIATKICAAISGYPVDTIF